MHSFSKTYHPLIAAMIVPTGIGARTGGFAGDATPAMNLIAGVCDILITHPNVANAAIFQKLPDNALYVEGYALDQFFKGEWYLQPTRSNRIGIVMDAGIPGDMRIYHLNTIRAIQAVYGIDVVAVETTREPIHIEYGINDDSGCSSGSLLNPDVLVEAAERLVQQGANAIALCIFFKDNHLDDETENNYRQGTGVDPVGGVEAILSHTIVSQLKIPCANSPVFSREAAMPGFQELIDAKSASEYLAPTFLPCVLQGLSKAPQIHSQANYDTLSISQLSALIIPANALGGVPVFAALAQNIPIIAVEENQTICKITTDYFKHSSTPIYKVRSYCEAAGLLQAMKQGIAPSALGLYAVNQPTNQITDKPTHPKPKTKVTA